MKLKRPVPPESNIRTAGDAVWWSLTTITTVGYGDHYPVTFAGRIIASLLMMTGVGLFGTLSGVVASFFLGGDSKADETAGGAGQRELLARLDSIQRQLAGQREPAAPLE